MKCCNRPMILHRSDGISDGGQNSGPDDGNEKEAKKEAIVDMMMKLSFCLIMMLTLSVSVNADDASQVVWKQHDFQPEPSANTIIPYHINLTSSSRSPQFAAVIKSNNRCISIFIS